MAVIRQMAMVPEHVRIRGISPHHGQEIKEVEAVLFSQGCESPLRLVFEEMSVDLKADGKRSTDNLEVVLPAQVFKP